MCSSMRLKCRQSFSIPPIFAKKLQRSVCYTVDTTETQNTAEKRSASAVNSRPASSAPDSSSPRHKSFAYLKLECKIGTGSTPRVLPTGTCRCKEVAKVGLLYCRHNRNTKYHRKKDLKKFQKPASFAKMLQRSVWYTDDRTKENTNPNIKSKQKGVNHYEKDSQHHRKQVHPYHNQHKQKRSDHYEKDKH